MLSEERWLRMMQRMCPRFLFLSSVSMSTFLRPIFLPISPASGMVVVKVTGVWASASVDFSCSFRLGLWPTNIRELSWHMAWISCRAGVRERLTGGSLRGVASRLTGAVFRGVRFSGLAVVDLIGVASSCLAKVQQSDVMLSLHIAERALWEKTSSVERLWRSCLCFLSAGSSSDWEPPSLRVESLFWRCKRERRLASVRFGVSGFPLEVDSSSRNEPSWSTDESWDLSRVKEPKPLSSHTDLWQGWMWVKGIVLIHRTHFLFSWANVPNLESIKHEACTWYIWVCVRMRVSTKNLRCHIGYLRHCWPVIEKFP